MNLAARIAFACFSITWVLLGGVQLHSLGYTFVIVFFGLARTPGTTVLLCVYHITYNPCL